MPYQPIERDLTRDILTVSRLNSEVRAVLEGSFPLLWVEGEISNLARPASGHIYFSLKDNHAQVRCAMFRMKRQRLRFQPDNGVQVTVRCRVSLYEGRGDFQLIVEHMEPAGEGALRQAFEQLKQKLAAEGLFDTELKKSLPAYPNRVGVITSPSGAAIRDVLNVLRRRFPIASVVLYPVPVQGSEAPTAIEEMIRLADLRAECDLLILTRGGGSLEDLSAFNDERVARAIHQARLPVVSAVGHEIDFTIADLVADQRAATPSAAAELVTPDSRELIQQLNSLQHRMELHSKRNLNQTSSCLDNLTQRLTRHHPGSRLQQRQQRLDEMTQRLVQEVDHQLRHRLARLHTVAARLETCTPIHRLARMKQHRELLLKRLSFALNSYLNRQRQRIATAAGNLHTLSPLATLERGYSITSLLPDGGVIRNASSVSEGDRIETRLAHGSLTCRVDRIHDPKH